VDKTGISAEKIVVPKNKKTVVFACISFFLLMCTWLSIPHGATGDMDFHLASIWCAQGEKEGLCADIDRVSNTAEVPFMFQMCNSRNIDYWPYCEIDEVHPETQRLRMAPISSLSFYYKIVHVFVDDHIQQSVLKIRLFNSFISSLVLFALLSFTNRRIRFAAVAGFTFSIIPFGLQHFSGVTTRGWSVLAVMTSWAFLASYLLTPKNDVRLRMLQLSAYVFTILLALFSRIDALMMVMITSLFIIISHLVSTAKVNKRQFFFGISGIALLAGVAQLLPGIRNQANFVIPDDFGTAQYIVFQLVHLPEYMADWWNYSIGQDGSGPGVIGLIGVLLFAINLAFALQKSDLRQRILFTSFTLVIFVLFAKSGSVVGVMVPLTAFYTLGMAVPWIGLTIASSRNKLQFMSSLGNRRVAISLLSFSHAVFFYNLLEFFTKRGTNTRYFETISLNDVWWWSIWIGPNTVWVTGAVLFPVFLSALWRSIPLEIPER
jgi:hypothetical protein